MEIALSNVTKLFGSQRAVDDISFVVRPGITGFLGPNGAGKSTTMRMITGFLEPSAGSISLDGVAVWPTSTAVRARIGYLPEHNPLYPEMYVREYLAFIARAHGVKAIQHRVEEVIDTVGLRLESHKRISMLSKGYRQRVGLAQALLHDPDVLILDEPTSGLDPNQLVEIRQVIERLGEEKIVLLSTHIMQEVQALCQRVLIIDRGKLIADDPIERLTAHLAGRARVRMVCLDVPDAAMLSKVPGVLSVSVSKTTAMLELDSQREVRPALAQLATKQEWGLLELVQEADSVEATFQALTSGKSPQNAARA